MFSKWVLPCAVIPGRLLTLTLGTGSGIGTGRLVFGRCFELSPEVVEEATSRERYLADSQSHLGGTEFGGEPFCCLFSVHDP